MGNPAPLCMREAEENPVYGDDEGAGMASELSK